MTDRDSVENDVRQMRQGLRTTISALASSTVSEVRRRSPGALVAAMCAGALAPVVVAAAGFGTVLVATAGVFGSIGANSLTRLLEDVVSDLRATNSVDRTALEDRLRVAIQERLDAADSSAAELSRDSAQFLQRIGGVKVAIATATEVGATDMCGQLVAAFVMLAKDSHDLLATITDAISSIQATLDQDGRTQRAHLEMTRESLIELRRLRKGVFHAQRTAPSSQGIHTPDSVAGSPYRGLWAFHEEHGHIFFGREREASQLLGHVGERLTGPSVVVVTGASGVGKSSLICAGLLPAVADGLLGPPGSARWPRRVMTPRTAPLDELATLLSVLGDLDLLALRQSLLEHPDEAHLLVQQALLSYQDRQAAQPSNPESARGMPRLLLVVDQFEQVFDMADRDNVRREQASFVRAIVAAASTPRSVDGLPPAVLIVCVRGDFWDRCTELPALGSELQAGQFVVTSMSETGLRQTIVEPANEARLDLEPNLADRILDDLRSGLPGWRGSRLGANVLPLLSQAMLLTWEHREDSMLTWRGYQQQGGVRDAVATSADDLLSKLTDRQKDLCRLVFVHLTQITRSGRFARRRVRRAELVAESADTDHVAHILGLFTDKRLLVSDADYVEIAHDSVLDAWPRLRDWLEADREAFARYGQLVERSATWLDEHRDPSYLYQGTELAAIHQLVYSWQADPDRYPSLDTTSQEFVQTSSRRDRRRRHVRRSVITALVGSLVLMALGTITIARSADTLRKTADAREEQHHKVLARQLVAQADELRTSNPRVSMLLAATAQHYAPLPDARRAMLDSLSQPARDIFHGHAPSPGAPGGGFSVAFSPNGHTLASGGFTDGTVNMWDSRTHRRRGAPIKISHQMIDDLAFSADSSELVVATGDGTVQRFRVATRKPVGEPLSIPDATDIALTEHGERLITVVVKRPDDGTPNRVGYQVWDTVTREQIGQPPQSGSSNEVADRPSILPAGLALSPDGTVIALSSSDGGVQLLDVATNKTRGQPIVSPDQIFGLTFSPDGHWVGGTDNAGSAHVWNVITHAEITPLPLPIRGYSPRLAFTPDGGTILGLLGDGSMRLYDTKTGRLVGDLRTGHQGLITDVAFANRGTRMATTGQDGSVRLWDLSNRRTTALIPTNSDLGASIAVSPSGEEIAVGSGNGPITVWDVRSRRPLGAPLTGHASAYGVAFSPDGQTLASVGGDDETLRLWNVAHLRPIVHPLAAHAFDVAFSPNGQVVAAAAYPTIISMWNPHTGQSLGELRTGHSGGTFEHLAFSTDGRYIVASTTDEIWAWNTETHEPVGAAVPGTGGETPVAFRPNSSTIAYVDGADHVAFRDIAAARAVGQPLSTEQNGVWSLAFSPDGRILAVGGGDGTVRFWDIETHNAIGQPLPVQTNGVTKLAFTPDGHTLVSAGGATPPDTSTAPPPDPTGAVRLSRVSFPIDATAAVCAAAGSPLSTREWNRYLKGETYIDVCRDR